MDHGKVEKTRPLSREAWFPMLPEMKSDQEGRFGKNAFPWGKLLLSLLFLVLGSWGAAGSLEKGQKGWVPPPPFQLSRWKPLRVKDGEPRILPWVHRDFELTGRVVVPRGKHMDLVFHLEKGPFQSSPEDDRTLPQGPLDWSALRLSAGDLGPPFFSSRNLPKNAGGWRVPPGNPADIRLVLKEGVARVEVGHKALPSTWKVHTREGILAFVGEGTWETLRLKALDKGTRSGFWFSGFLLWFLGTLVLALAARWIRLPGPSLLWGGGLAASAAWISLFVPGPPMKASWNPKGAPSFQEALGLYGRADAFRNWGAYAGSLYWRGRIETRFSPGRGKRVLFLGGPQVWGRGVVRKEVSFPMQVEGVLEGGRTPGSPPVHVLVGACRDTDLERQVTILEKELLSFEPDALVLVLPAGSLQGKRPLEERLGPFFRLCGEKGLPFLLVPPLVPGGPWDSLECIQRAAREAGGKVWDPTFLLKEEAGLFLASSQGPAGKGDLSPKGHLLLGPPLARELQEMVRF